MDEKIELVSPGVPETISLWNTGNGRVEMNLQDAGRIVRNLTPGRLAVHMKHPWFSMMVWRTNGMLAPSIYKRIFTSAGQLPDLPFVEIGAGSGAATIAIARAYKRARHRSKVVAIEKCHGGSRKRYGGFEENLEILNRNLARYAVSDNVTIFDHSLKAETIGRLYELIDGTKISGFMHDADGRLDRDFPLFWPMTMDGGLIVVDDCPGDTNMEELVVSKGFSGRKLYMTSQAWQVIQDAELVSDCVRIGTTVFARKNGAIPLAKMPESELGRTIQVSRDDYNDALKRV